MSGDGRCDHEGSRFHRLGCIECGTTCCPACAIHLESAIYCGACAGALLETTAVRAGGPFDLR